VEELVMKTAVFIRGSHWAACYGKIFSKISDAISNPSQFLLKKLYSNDLCKHKNKQFSDYFSF